MRDYQGHHKSNVSFEFFISGNRALAGTIIGLELHYSTRKPQSVCHRLHAVVFGYLCKLLVKTKHSIHYGWGEILSCQQFVMTLR